MIDPSSRPTRRCCASSYSANSPARSWTDVAAYLERHPEVASTLHALNVSDTLLDALKRRERTDDPPALAALISRLSALSAASSDTPTSAADAGNQTDIGPQQPRNADRRRIAPSSQCSRRRTGRAPSADWGATACSACSGAGAWASCSKPKTTS